MVQHESNQWSWGRYVVVYPQGNTDQAEICSRYRSWLVDDSTFDSMTLEDLLRSRRLPAKTVTALRERYVAD
jgi:hypothetical protein